MAIPLLGALVALISAPGMLQSFANIFPPFGSLTTRRGWNDRPNLIPTPDELVNMRIRGVMSRDAYIPLMRQLGFDEPTADNLFNAGKSYLSAFEYITLWRRGDIDETTVDRLLGEIGVIGDEIARVKQVTLYFPTPQDIVRFAVREVYTPSSVAQYGLMEDMPPEYIENAEKAGLARSTAENYWAAHWEYPSPTQVFEMLHRRKIDEAGVREYLKAADYAPAWRELLMEISYNPLTRVDVRRMHAFGVLDDDAVYNAYRDAGYNDVNARYLTEFTIQYNKGTEGEAPKTEILKAYASGLIDRSKAVTDLGQLRYSAESIDTLLDLEDNKLNQERIDLEADAIIDQFQRGAVDINQVKAALTTLGVTPRMMEITIARELAQARKRVKVASKTDLDRWLTYALITPAIYTSKMSMLGYSGEDIGRYLEEVYIEIIHGSTKKLPYAEAFRNYSNGSIDFTVLEITLGGMGYTGTKLQSLVSIARGLRS